MHAFYHAFLLTVVSAYLFGLPYLPQTRSPESSTIHWKIQQCLKSAVPGHQACHTGTQQP